MEKTKKLVCVTETTSCAIEAAVRWSVGGRAWRIQRREINGGAAGNKILLLQLTCRKQHLPRRVLSPTVTVRFRKVLELAVLLSLHFKQKQLLHLFRGGHELTKNQNLK